MNLKNISLIGFMGSGKSTVGEILSKKTGFIFIDIDKVIEWLEEKNIKQIFEIEGELYFRNLETKVIKNIYFNRNCIFACGGGALNRGENISIIKKNSLIIYLYVSPQQAYKRLKKVKDRPLLEVKNRYDAIEKLLNQREKIYKSCADLIINTDEEKPVDIAEEIIYKLKKYNLK